MKFLEFFQYNMLKIAYFFSINSEAHFTKALLALKRAPLSPLPLDGAN